MTAFPTLSPRALVPVLEDLQIAPDRLRQPTDAPGGPVEGRTALVALPPTNDPASFATAILEHARASTTPTGWLLVFVPGKPTDAQLAALRDALWPAWHVSALYSTSHRGLVRRTLEGLHDLHRGIGHKGVLVAARGLEAVLAPDATVAKFDKNAAGWNGRPGQPGHAHFRWMRRFVAEMAGEHRAQRILDFGCGAGWVGIEAATAAQSRGGTPELCAFDPSPEMVRMTEENARAAGVAHTIGRTGFGEDPPFPAAGESAFDLVLASGVVSFARDRERWFDGLARTVAPRGTLVIGDVHPGSKGMQRRRREKPLLPVREMNAIRREEARAALESRGFRFEAWSGYQLSDPVPQWNHIDATRLRGLLGPTLLAWNRRAAAQSLANDGAGQDRFDSWAMRLVRG